MPQRRKRQPTSSKRKRGTGHARDSRIPAELRTPDGRIDETLVASVMQGVENLIVSESLYSGGVDFVTEVFVFDDAGKPLPVKELNRAERIELTEGWSEASPAGDLTLSSGRVVRVLIDEDEEAAEEEDADEEERNVFKDPSSKTSKKKVYSRAIPVVV